MSFCSTGCPVRIAVIQGESVSLRLPGAINSLIITMTMTNSQSTKRAGGRLGNGFYAHLKVRRCSTTFDFHLYFSFFACLSQSVRVRWSWLILNVELEMLHILIQMLRMLSFWFLYSLSVSNRPAFSFECLRRTTSEDDAPPSPSCAALPLHLVQQQVRTHTHTHKLVWSSLQTRSP